MLPIYENFILEQSLNLEFTDSESLISEWSINEDSWDDLRDGLKQSFEETGIPGISRFVQDTAKRSFSRIIIIAIITIATFMLLRKLYQVAKKRYQIKKILSREQDPVKREKLRAELSSLNKEEIDIKSRISDKNEKLKSIKEKMKSDELKDLQDDQRIIKLKVKQVEIKNAIKVLKEKEKELHNDN